MTTTATLTVTALQQCATRVLATLLGEELPAASWTVTPYIIDAPELSGQLDSYHRSLADRRTEIEAWGNALGTPPVLRRLQAPSSTHAGSLRVLAERAGVQVDVWVALTAEDLAELDTEQVPAVSGG
ncbi:hypothetical protein ABT061_15635 [Streptosporangium sp. NPDC002544]|uniref:hypothetical protein n=1 Tax=Streptosporangium sp. NPDC002544 TaxID=3154538 RepID=UPI0033303518